MITYLNTETGETYEAAGPVIGLENSSRWQRADDPTSEQPKQTERRLTEKQQLVEGARSRGLDESGKAADIRARIAAYDAEQAALSQQGDGEGGDGTGEPGV